MVGTMAKIDDSVKKKVPELRFKGFTDEWEERKLKDIAQFNPKTVLPDEFEYVDLESVVGTEMISHRTESKDQAPSRAQRLAQKGDVFYQTVRPYQMNNYLYDLPYDNYVFSTGYAQMRPNIDSYFLLNSVQNKQFVQHVLDRSTGTSYPAINSSDLSNIEIHVPSKLSEQQKIGAFFQSIDDTIALHQRKLDLLKEQKKGYLQKMFPKNGEKVPELRFAGFADDWEERKFEDLLDSKDGVRRGPFGSALKKEFFVENSEYVVYEQQNAIYDNYHTRYKITKEKFDELSKFKLNPGDFIMSGAGTIGRISRVPDGVKLGVFNQALIRFRINPEITDSEYFIQFVRADFMQKNLTGANPGSAITNLVPMSEVKKWEIKAPHLEEQEKIGSFFAQLDNTIALHQRKLDLLKEQKKGFLQKMFV